MKCAARRLHWISDHISGPRKAQCIKAGLVGNLGRRSGWVAHRLVVWLVFFNVFVEKVPVCQGNGFKGEVLPLLDVHVESITQRHHVEIFVDCVVVAGTSPVIPDVWVLALENA